MRAFYSKSLLGGFAPPAVRQTSAVFFMTSLIDEQTATTRVSTFLGKCLFIQERVYFFREMTIFPGKCLPLQKSDYEL